MTIEIGLSKSSKIARTLEQEIRSGQFERGDQLASENELVRRFSVSRNTVRKGLEELARQGLITTRSGIGSFVTYDGSSIDNALGWTRALAKTHDVVNTRTIRLQRDQDRKACKFLSLSTDDFLCVDRLRFLKSTGIAISLERSRLPWRRAFEPVLTNGLIKDSLGETCASFGLVVDHGEEWAEVLPRLPGAEAALMSRTAGEPMLRLKRVTRSISGDVVEYVESILDPLRFGLHLEF